MASRRSRPSNQTRKYLNTNNSVKATNINFGLGKFTISYRKFNFNINAKELILLYKGKFFFIFFY